MANHNISAELTDEQLQSIKAALATIRTALPFLITLTKEERRSLYKMKDQRLAFVAEAITAAENHGQALPGTFRVAEFQKDFALARVLAEVRALLGSLYADVDDTTMAVGSEAMLAATAVRRYVTEGAKTTPGLKATADRLAEFFERAGGEAPSPGETPGGGTAPSNPA